MIRFRFVLAGFMFHILAAMSFSQLHSKPVFWIPNYTGNENELKNARSAALNYLYGLSISSIKTAHMLDTQKLPMVP